MTILIAAYLDDGRRAIIGDSYAFCADRRAAMAPKVDIVKPSNYPDKRVMIGTAGAKAMRELLRQAVRDAFIESMPESERPAQIAKQARDLGWTNDEACGFFAISAEKVIWRLDEKGQLEEVSNGWCCMGIGDQVAEGVMRALTRCASGYEMNAFFAPLEPAAVSLRPTLAMIQAAVRIACEVNVYCGGDSYEVTL